MMTPLTHAGPTVLHHGTRVLLRADYNVPLKNGVVSEPLRIDASLETLNFLRAKGAKTLIISHLGRPEGRVEALSLAPIAAYLSQKLGVPVPLVSGGPETWAAQTAALFQTHDILLLENIRFFGQEEADDAAFADVLTSVGDVYVNDAFSVAHRAHASVHALPQRMPQRFMGFLLARELQMIAGVMSDGASKKRLAVVGGSKISTKIGVLRALLPQVNRLAVVGAMANTFLKARGLEVGASLAEDAWVAEARELESTWGAKLWIPPEVMVQAPGGEVYARQITQIQKGDCILDAGPEAIKSLEVEVAGMDLVFWNGPLGRFETPPFDAGSMAFAQFLAQQTKTRALKTIIGGGETAVVAELAGVMKDLTYVSLAGGALLEWIEGRTLPGLSVLDA